jgi:ATP/maltotriose-dependent transcriptional regulator MalT
MGTRFSNNKDNTTTKGGTGITAGGDVSFGDVSGQVAIGKFINQFRIEKPSGEELFKLMDLLDQKRREEVNKDILSKYTSSELPDYPSQLKEFVTHNRADKITNGLIYLQDHRLFLVSGVGGVGKTTLARALVETRPANIPVPFWFDFGKKMDATLGDILEKLASYLKMPDIARFKDEAREAGQEDINRLTDELHKRMGIWLVFDNLETILDDKYFPDPDIDHLFTSLRGSTHQAKIIVTSRTVPVLKNGDTLVDKQELKGLELNFAVDYLRKNGLDNVESEKLEELAR